MLGFVLIGSSIQINADQNKFNNSKELENATFAGGCFWCMEEVFDPLPGVSSTTSGYMGGHIKNPTYKDVSGGKTGHAEVVRVVYDPKKISFPELLEVFWRNIDPTTDDRQFCDIGRQYRPAIFYHNDQQKRLAHESKAKLDETKPFSEPILAEITAVSEFYAAEEYHQDFYQKNPTRYKFYKYTCGRAKRLKELWG